MKIPLMLAAGWLALGCAAAPYSPGSGATVVETVARRVDTPDIRQLQARLATAPGDMDAALLLARRYIALGRSETDPRYFGYAQAALAPWWQRVDTPPRVRLLRAILLQNGHQFSAALADLRAVTASEPANGEAWLTQAIVQSVQGDYAGATASCARVTTLADELAGFACLAAASVNTNRAAASERLLAATLARADGAPSELRVWALTLLAEMAARRGGAGIAEQRYRAALALAPRDSYLLGAYADFLLDLRRPAEVVALLRDQQRIDALLLRYVLALRVQGGSRAALVATEAELQSRFDAAAQRGDRVHLREQARFTLHVRGDAAGALVLARQNWAVQKEPADLRILLEAAQRAGDQATVRAVRGWIQRNGTQDVVLASLTRGGT